MILADTGPLVALFDPKDRSHEHCIRLLRTLREPVRTTIPVLTEAFHLLGPASGSSAALRQFVSFDSGFDGIPGIERLHA